MQRIGDFEWLNLLDITCLDDKAKFWDATESDIKHVTDWRVIDQDVLRTRANEQFFKSKRVRSMMRQSLLLYCGYYRLSYMQG